MRRLIGLLALAAFWLSQPAQAQPSPMDHLPILSGDYVKVEAKALKRDFHVFVRLPEKYD